MLTAVVVKLRSPVLGFNHNVLHLGWVFHVQTEDSGVQNPHLFTHLFHGGVIIATKKVVYDAAADPDVVKGLMQAQHKAMLKELKSGVYDEKIHKYLKDVPKDGEGGLAAPPMAQRAATPNPVPQVVAAEQDKTVDTSSQSRAATVVDPSPPVPVADPPATAPAARKPGGTVPPYEEELPTGPLPRVITVPTELPQVEFRTPRRPAPATGAPDPAADVSAAFRAMSAQTRESTRIPPGLAQAAATAARAPAGTAAADEELLDIEIGPLPTPPPGAGVWSGKPEIAQERPFERSGAVRTPDAARAAPPGTAPSPGFRPAIERRTVPPPSGVPTPLPPTPTPSAGISRPVPRTTQTQGTPPGATQQRVAVVPSSQVVVARPAVIVGAPPVQVGARKPRESSRPPEGFGKDLISERSLDEVIMAYLSEDAGEE